ncbi:hypothetical protein DUI87_10693 [Hirundo rustica rustica]|uniref:Uncharacterized protein n=1 Tax=Hirundo rustica rustica TaxID=333673 RepID=A0A3M0KKJ1_HIRRU|nr:hypothetical protein DUI87_10693 [Hirundo rustica rustica]
MTTPEHQPGWLVLVTLTPMVTWCVVPRQSPLGPAKPVWMKVQPVKVFQVDDFRLIHGVCVLQYDFLGQKTCKYFSSRERPLVSGGVVLLHNGNMQGTGGGLSTWLNCYFFRIKLLITALAKLSCQPGEDFTAALHPG